jgi:HEPN superfamily protein
MKTPCHAETLEELYDFLVGTNLQDLPSNTSLEYLSALVDLSLDLRQTSGLHLALRWGEELEQRKLDSQQLALLHYFRSNAWANLRDLPRIIARAEEPQSREDVEQSAWEWEREETEKQILYLRSAIKEEGFLALPRPRQSQILTNLANLYDTVGRFVEALECWEEVLFADSSFGMARGNKGIGLGHYAYAIYDPGHKVVFFRHALSELQSALSTDLHPDARESFDRRRKEIETVLASISTPETVDMDNYALGDCSQEIEYRTWCLANRLFLNPLNDLGSYAIGAQDVLTAPDIVYGLEDAPYYHGYFDQMKQEFVSARYLYYEGVNETGTHFSDKGVLLYNILDYPVYSFSVEKVKAAYRVAYSLLDKVAYFLNAYLHLSIPEHQVAFRTFWYNDRQKKQGLRDRFTYYPNLPLRGLFWLGKDLFEDAPGFTDSTSPDAQCLATIRNHLEHRYLKIHDDMWWESTDDAGGESDTLSTFLNDSLALSLHRRDFQEKTLRLLKLVRAALVYLSLAVHREERLRKKGQDPEGITISGHLDVWEDDWKT